MNFLETLLTSLFLAVGIVVVLFLVVALFSRAFEDRQYGGGYAIAGAILVGAGFIALAILRRGGGS